MANSFKIMALLLMVGLMLVQVLAAVKRNRNVWSIGKLPAITRMYTRYSRYRRWQRQDFRILDRISKVLIIDLNNNEKQTLWDEDIGPFQRRRTYRVETRGQDAILSYWFNTDKGDGGVVGRSCGGGRSASSPSSSSPTPCWIHQIAGTSVSFLLM